MPFTKGYCAPNDRESFDRKRVAEAALLQPLWEFDDVLKVLGGGSAVARLCRQQPSAVSNWRRRHGRFPCKYYLALRCALEDQGFYPGLELFNFFRAEDYYTVIDDAA